MIESIKSLDGISDKRFKKLKSKGIETLHQLVAETEESLVQILDLSADPNQAKDILFKASLLLRNQLYLKKPLEIPPPAEILYFDIEASAKAHNLFLVTFMTTDGDPVSFFKKKKKDFERKISAFLSEHTDRILVSSSGNSFDIRCLKKALKIAGEWQSAFDDLKHLDLMKQLKGALISPVGFSVKKLSNMLGYVDYERQLLAEPQVKDLLDRLRKTNGTSHLKLGYAFALAYDRRFLNDDIRKLMIKYNVMDVKALKFIYETIYTKTQGIQPGFINL